MLNDFNILFFSVFVVNNEILESLQVSEVNNNFYAFKMNQNDEYELIKNNVLADSIKEYIKSIK